MNPPINKYQAIQVEYRESQSRWLIIACHWLVLLFLSLLFADEIHYKISDKTQNSWILSISLRLKQSSEYLDIISTRRQIQNRIQSKYERIPAIGNSHIPSKTTSAQEKPLFTKIPKTTESPSIIEELSQESIEEITSVETISYLPSKILLVGASSMRASLGRNLRKALQGWNSEQTEREVNLHAKLGTGLSRPDVYNWFTVTQDLVEEWNPQMVVAQFIGNDCQTLVTTEGTESVAFSDSKWKEQYKERVLNYISMLQNQNIEVVLIGMPMVQSPTFQKRLQIANQQVQEAAQEKGVLFIDTWNFPLDDKGNLLKELRFNGRTYAFRHQDGIHFTRYGGEYMAEKIYHTLIQTYPIPPQKDK